MQCTDEEIAAWFGIRRETFCRKKTGAILEALERGRAKGRASLRRAQFQNAIKGNATMQIWLGKQLLGQKDIVTTEHAGTIGIDDGRADRYKNLSVDELRTVTEIMERATPADGPSVH